MKKIYEGLYAVGVIRLHMQDKTNRLTMIFDRNYRLLVMLVIALALFNLFYLLGSGAIHDWDEARHGVNAYEMMVRGNFIVSTYDYQVDYYNTKPPLGMWFIVFAYKVFGYNAFALRFFSAMSALFTIVLVLYTARQKINKTVSILAGIILATNLPFILIHSSRTGDFDAMFTLLMTACIVFFIKMDENITYLYLAGLTLSAAFLLKGLAIIQIIAVLATYLLLSGKLKTISLKQYGIFLSASALPAIGWGIARYASDGFPFLKLMIIYDVVARSTRTIEGHSGGYLYYLDYLFTENPFWTYYYFAILLVSILLLRRIWEPIVRNKTVLILVLAVIVPFVLFSIAKSKLRWYINPIYPPLAVLVAWLTHRVMVRCKKFSSIIGIVALSMLMLAAGISEYIIWQTIHLEKPLSQRLLSDLGKQNIKTKNIYAVNWSQADLFAAEVEGGLSPKHISEVGAFLKLEQTDDMLLLTNSPSNLRFVAENDLRIVQQSGLLLVVAKN